MKIKLNINRKLLLFVLGNTIIVFIAAIGYISFTLREFSTDNYRKILESKTVEIANHTEQELSSYVNTAQILATAFSQFNKISEENRREDLAKMLRDIMIDNENILSAWSICESNSIDNLDTRFVNQLGSTILGNFRYIYFRENGEIKLSSYIEQNPMEVFNGKIYNRVKNDLIFTVIEPYFYSYNQNRDSILQTSLVFPIINNGQFIGVIGIDAPMNQLQKYFSKKTPMEGGRIYILTQAGNFISHPDSSFLGKSFTSFAPAIEDKHQILETIAEGKSLTFSDIEPQTNKKSAFYLKPILLGQSKTPWAFGLSVPLSELYEGANLTFTKAIIIGLLGMICISIIIFAISYSITKPLGKATLKLQLIAKGDLQKIEDDQKTLIQDEISDLGEAMNALTQGLRSATNFAQEIGKGRLDVKYKMLSDNDLLGESLITMQNSLIQAKEEEDKKKIEDEKRNWVIHGLASFGEIIRQHNDDISKFSLNVTKNLIKYIGASQGAMYISQQNSINHSEDLEFELIAAIAYGKQVKITKTALFGQEILGRAAEENKTIILEDLPESYVHMSPGLKNKARPKNLLIIPISNNDNPLGIFELISYEKFEPHKIEFITKLCENIASVISSVKTNQQTVKLLAQSQEQADILGQHEEEMRQNLEEMQATQEESIKREETLKSYIKGVKSTIMFAELDIEGRILDLSPYMSNIYGANSENLRGKFYDAIIAQDGDSRKDFNAFWTKMIQNGGGKRKQVITSRNKQIWLVESYKVIERERLAPIVLIMAIDRTKEKETEEMLVAEMKAAKEE